MTRLLCCAAVLGALALDPCPAAADEALVRYYQCDECHSGADDALGPDFTAVAARYANDADARDALIAIIKNGGKGNWPEVSRGLVMPPYYADMSDAEIAQVVDWILDRQPVGSPESNP